MYKGRMDGAPCKCMAYLESLERHGNSTASNAYVAVTLHDWGQGN